MLLLSHFASSFQVVQCERNLDYIPEVSEDVCTMERALVQTNIAKSNEYFLSYDTVIT